MTDYPIVPGVRFQMITGFPRYCIGDNASVWARLSPFSRRITGMPNNGWRTINTRIGGRGYSVVTLWNKTHTTIPVHTLVLTEFVGQRLNGMEACHYDGDRSNSVLANLRWGTRQDNMNDMIRIGRSNRGTRNHTAKINDEIVREMRKLRLTGLSYRRIGERFGLGEYSTQKAIDGRCWKHVD